VQSNPQWSQTLSFIHVPRPKPQAPLNPFILAGQELSRERARRIRIRPSRATVPVISRSGVVVRLIPCRLRDRIVRDSADAEGDVDAR
jgi:hypothetical protein